jgi:hypothetical protein
MTNHQKIIELNEIWYNLIGCEYHKDRDCHFYIYTHYFYGDNCQYMVEHKGYINYRYEDTYWDTYEDAEKELIRLLKEIIIKEVDFYLEHYGDKDWDQHAKYDKEKLEQVKKDTIDI